MPEPRDYAAAAALLSDRAATCQKAHGAAHPLTNAYDTALYAVQAFAALREGRVALLVGRDFIGFRAALVDAQYRVIGNVHTAPDPLDAITRALEATDAE